MARQVALLRGINLGPKRRISMPELRKALSAAGYGEVATIAQSGNVVLGSALAPPDLERECEKLIAERFGFEVPVIVRTGEEMREVVARNPLADLADEHKRYQVSFLSEALDPERVAQLSELARGDERLVSLGRELYAWHPDGVARSKLWAGLAAAGLGVKATARNWNTVTALAEMASA